MFKRSISDGVTVVCWLTPEKPVKNAVIRSLRGKFVGASVAKFVPRVVLTASLNKIFNSSGSEGCDT